MKPKNKLLSFSTTIRNPERYAEFLSAIKKFTNSPYNSDLLLGIEEELISFGIYRPLKKEREVEEKWNKKERLDQLTTKKIMSDNPQKFGWERRAETHLTPLKELALVRVKDGRFFVTKLGLALLTNDLNINDFYTKILLKFQFGNPFRKTVNNKSNPFLFTLHVVNQVNLMWKELGKKPVGISRVEFQHFILPMVDNDYKIIAEEIISYRKKFGFISNESVLQNFIYQRFSTKKEIKNLKETIRDYADNVIRHFRFTGLISFRGSARFIDISDGFSEIVEGILSNFKLEWKNFASEEDYVDFLLSDIEIKWKEEKRDKKNMLLNFINFNKVNLNEAKDELLHLIKKEKGNSVAKIGKTFLKGLSNEEMKSWWIRKISPPLKLEFLLTILFFLKFNSIEINPNFLMDDEGLPYHHAPAGKSDIEITFNGRSLLVEATLLIDKTGQSNNETSSIIRRGSNYQNKTKLTTYSMLVAPRIHFDTILFFKSLLHDSFRSLKCNAFPISIEKFIENFINENEKIETIVENTFSKFKNAGVDELSKNVN